MDWHVRTAAQCEMKLIFLMIVVNVELNQTFKKAR